MNSFNQASDLLPGAPLSRAPRLLSRLLWLYGSYAAAAALLLGLGAFPIWAPAKLKGLATEFLISGLGPATLVAAVLSLTVLASTALLANGRLAQRQIEVARLAGEFDASPMTLLTPLWRLGPGVLARQGQAIMLPAGAMVIGLLAKLVWAGSVPAVPPPVTTDANLVATLVIGLAFPSLIAERMINAFPAAQMPEAPGLRHVLLLTTLMLAIAGAAEIGRSVGFGWALWIQQGLSVGAALIALELSLRALARLFLPLPSAETAKAATDSILAALITGGPRAPAILIRTHLGLDFTRSWALSYLIKAAAPALVCTLILCWTLSGVKLLDGDQRGVYERLGAPVAVLGPGFHVLLPWPLGRLRAVEYGTTHIIAVGAEQGPDAFEKTEKTEKIGAEDIPQASMNRLWDTAHATEAEYLVASEAEGQQGFQAVNGEILVIYRTGMSDADAMQAVYGSADPATVVEEEANRLITRYFSSHTLDQVLGGQRESLQELLRADLARAVADDRAGVDIVAVLIDAIHPPAGAAAAYHAVQAAEINAAASVALASAHATRTAGEAGQEAYQAETAAHALAVEKMQTASGDAYQFSADRNAYATSPAAFLLERRVRNLGSVSRGYHLTVLDRRLKTAPFIDLRSAAASSVSAVSGPAASPDFYSGELPTPSTSTEGPPPPLTNEEAAEQSARSHASSTPDAQQR